MACLYMSGLTVEELMNATNAQQVHHLPLLMRLHAKTWYKTRLTCCMLPLQHVVTLAYVGMAGCIDLTLMGAGATDNSCNAIARGAQQDGMKSASTINIQLLACHTCST